MLDFFFNFFFLPKKKNRFSYYLDYYDVLASKDFFFFVLDIGLGTMRPPPPFFEKFFFSFRFFGLTQSGSLLGVSSLPTLSKASWSVLGCLTRLGPS